MYVPDHRAVRSAEDWFAADYLRPIEAWPSEAIQNAARHG
jgi:hypothetical protein